MTASNETVIPTICGFCHANCGILACVSDGELRRIKADRTHPASRGDICPKGIAAPQVVHSPDRLKYPLRRTKNGFQRISWDEALDIIATRLTDIKEKYGAETLIHCRGAPVTEVVRDGFMQFMAAYGSMSSTGIAHLCHIPRVVAYQTVFGEMPYTDYQHTKCMVIWGSNPSDSQYHGAAYGRFMKLIPEAKRRGAKLIVIDPRRIDLVDIADKWLPIEPGRDDALALAMLNVIINEGIYDREFVSRQTVGFEQLAKHVARFTPEWAQDITRLPANDIREVARMYATTSPAFIKAGNFIDQYPNAVQTMRAIAIIIAITGNLDIEGGNVFFPEPALTPLLSKRPPVKTLSTDTYPLFPRVPFPSFTDAIFSGKPYTPRAMIVQHGNPALVNADSTRCRQALEKLEFLVVCDIFPTATAELADIILPAATEFEHCGFRCYPSAEGGFVALSQKVIEPVGESRPLMEMEYALARKMGLHAAFPWTNTEEWVNHRLKASGITVDDLKKQPVIYTTPPMEYRKYLKKGFHTPSGKVEIYSTKLKDYGYPPLPEYTDLDADAAKRPSLAASYPLIGTTRRPGAYVHSRFRNAPRLLKMEPEPLVRLHPDDAAKRGIEDGDMTTVKSPQGSIEIRARITDETRPGVIIIDFGWGNPWDNKANVNILTSDVDRDPISGTTSNRRFRCQITRLNLNR